MKKNMINQTHIEGILYAHKLEAKESGKESKNPGTPYVTGTIDIATDNNHTNIVSVHFTYVAPTYPNKTKKNPNFLFLWIFLMVRLKLLWILIGVKLHVFVLILQSV